MSVGGCLVIAKSISLQSTLLHWWAESVDLDHSYCQGEQSPLGQHNSPKNSHWLYPTRISAKAFLHFVICVQNVSQFIKPMLVPAEVCEYKSCVCLRFGFLQVFKCYWQNKYMIHDLSLLVRVKTGTGGGWWCHLAVTMVMMCRSQLSMDAQICTARRGASGLARSGLVSDLALKQSSGHGTLGAAKEA